MARTPSTMLELGTPAPPFSLPDTEGKTISLHDVRGKAGLLVMFICNHCPFVIHVQGELVRLARDFMPKGIGMVAINANDVANYPDDSPEKMRLEKKRVGYPFAYLFDETQNVAKAYQAACTPDFYLFDKDLHLAYRGQLDDSRPGNDKPIDGHDLRAAMQALLSGSQVDPTQKPSLGCNIKWKPGQQPAYYP